MFSRLPFLPVKVLPEVVDDALDRDEPLHFVRHVIFMTVAFGPVLVSG